MGSTQLRSHLTAAVVFTLLAVAGTATACGTSRAGSANAAPEATNPPIVTAPKGIDVQRAWQRFVACMNHGTGLHVALMPPPLYGVRVALTAGSASQQTAAAQAAFKARVDAANAHCHHYLAPIQKSSNSPQDEARFRDRALAFARCLRRRGVNVGDPIIRKVVGGFDVAWPPAPGVRVASARWQAAEHACHSLNPIMSGK